MIKSVELKINRSFIITATFNDQRHANFSKLSSSGSSLQTPIQFLPLLVINNDNIRERLKMYNLRMKDIKYQLYTLGIMKE